MAHPSLVESLFNRHRSRNLSIYSTTKDSEDASFSEDSKIRLRFSVQAHTTFGWGLKIVGSLKELGSWNPNDAPLLTTSPEKYPLWTSASLSLPVSALPLCFEYKYIMFNQSNQVKWETFSSNRLAQCSEKPSKSYIFEIEDCFNKHSNAEMKIITKHSFTQMLSRIPDMRTLEEQLAALTELLGKETINYNTLALSCIVVKNMKNPVGSDYSSYGKFIEWCSQHISVQQTKILLSATMPTYMWLAIPTTDLIDKIEAYQEASQNTQDDSMHLLCLAELRMALLNEYQSSEDIAGLLITDTFLEQSELKLLERLMDSSDDLEEWKIVMIGMWTAQMLFLQCIKPKQASTMISQFEKLRRHESTLVVKDLLNEMLALILEVYSDLHAEVNHQECAALAGVLKSEYKILYSGIFSVFSKYLLKTLPGLNSKVLQIPFLCYNSGSCRGHLMIWNSEKGKRGEDLILVAEMLPEDYELARNVKALVVIFVESLFHTVLMQAKARDIPVAIGFFPPIIEGEYYLNVNEDSFTIRRA
jgi:hypothetical protein